jgi:hypothetical protein
MRSVDLASQLLDVRHRAGFADVRAGSVEQALIKKQGYDLCGSKMQPVMVRPRCGDQILRPVVVLDSVDVVNDYVRGERDPAGRLVDVSMLCDVAVSHRGFVSGLVEKDVAISGGIATALPSRVLIPSAAKEHSSVVPVEPSVRIADELPALWPGIFGDASGRSASAFADPAGRLPVTRRLQASSRLRQSQRSHSERRVVSQVVGLNIARWPSQVARLPRNLLVATTVAAIDRCIGGACPLASIVVRKLRFYARVASGVPNQILRSFSSAVARLGWNRLETAALADKSLGAHLPMIHLNAANRG